MVSMQRSHVFCWITIAIVACLPALVLNFFLTVYSSEPSQLGETVLVLPHHSYNISKQQPSVDSHPFGGARDEHGKLGYIHNARNLRQFPFNGTFSQACLDRPGRGLEGNTQAFQGLRKIILSPENNSTRLFCMVYTHSNRHGFVQAISETWGRKCDGFMAASNVTDPTIGAVDLTHAGVEEYDNIWQKVRSMWAYVYQNCLEDYDYFHIGGDDMYLVVENLKAYAAETFPNNTNEPIYMGGPIAGLMGRPRKTYCGGGSGYTLNRAAVKMLVEELLPTCQSNRTTSGEDLMMAICFLEKWVKCRDTSEKAAGAYRYHAQDVQYQAEWNFETGKHNIGQFALKKYHNMNIQQGIGGISNSSVAFHLKQLQEEDLQKTIGRIRRYHAILYGYCDGVFANQTQQQQHQSSSFLSKWFGNW